MFNAFYHLLSGVLAYEDDLSGAGILYKKSKKSFYDFVRRNFDWNWKIGKFVGY